MIKRTDDITGFVVLPRRWYVERSFAWLLRSRRLVRDYERRPDSSDAHDPVVDDDAHDPPPRRPAAGVNRPDGSLTSQPRSTSRLALDRTPSTLVFTAISTPSLDANSLQAKPFSAEFSTVTIR
ncbi:hypothetical protein [Streptomyces sp. NPDC002564]|uniref:hypothetical protein n=1 Tax=Streptomyces sp. NPDC002564 TaxID=3364649 RepID=UPI00367EADE1